VTLPGTVLLIERDGDWTRVPRWFYHYLLSSKRCDQIRVALHAVDLANGGVKYWFDGMEGGFWVHETVLEGKFSGRLYIEEYRGRPLMLLLILYL